MFKDRKIPGIIFHKTGVTTKMLGINKGVVFIGNLKKYYPSDDYDNLSFFDEEIFYDVLDFSANPNVNININGEVNYSCFPSVYENKSLSKYLNGELDEMERRLRCEYTVMPYDNFITPKEVIYNDPATIVFWEDGTKTIVKCQPGDTFSKELGLAMAIAKKVHGNKGNYNDLFKKWAYDD